MTAEVLVNHIEATHHQYLWLSCRGLPRWWTRSSPFTVSAILSWWNPSCFSQVRADLEPHMAKEERVLFPMIRELATSAGVPAFHCGSLRNPISVMLSEHDAVGDLLAQLRRLTGGYVPPADGCASYVACFAAMAELGPIRTCTSTRRTTCCSRW